MRQGEAGMLGFPNGGGWVSRGFRGWTRMISRTEEVGVVMEVEFEGAACEDGVLAVGVDVA